MTSLVNWQFGDRTHPTLRSWLQDLVVWVLAEGSEACKQWVQDMFWDLLRPPFASLEAREAWLAQGRPLWQPTELLEGLAHVGVWHFLWIHSVHFPECLRQVVQPVISLDLWQALGELVKALPEMLDPMTMIPKDTPRFWATFSYQPRTWEQEIRFEAPAAQWAEYAAGSGISDDSTSDLEAPVEPLFGISNWPVDQEPVSLASSETFEVNTQLTTEPCSTPMEVEVDAGGPAPVPSEPTLDPMDKEERETDEDSIGSDPTFDEAIAKLPMLMKNSAQRPKKPRRVQRQMLSVKEMVIKVRENSSLLPDRAARYDWDGLLRDGHRDFASRITYNAPLFSALHPEEADFVQSIKKKLFKYPTQWSPRNPFDARDRTAILSHVLLPAQVHGSDVTVRCVLRAMHLYCRYWIRLDELSGLFGDQLSIQCLRSLMKALIFYGWVQRRMHEKYKYIVGFCATFEARAMLSGKPTSAFSTSALDWAEFLSARQASMYKKYKAPKLQNRAATQEPVPVS